MKLLPQNIKGAGIIDIAALASVMGHSEIKQQASIAVLKMTIEQAKLEVEPVM